MRMTRSASSRLPLLPLLSPLLLLLPLLLCLTPPPCLAQFPSINTAHIEGHVVAVERITIRGVDSWAQTISTTRGLVRELCVGAALADCSTLATTAYGLIPAVLYHGFCVPVYESATGTGRIWACKPEGWGHCRRTAGYLKGGVVTSGFVTMVAETSVACN